MRASYLHSHFVCDLKTGHYYILPKWKWNALQKYERKHTNTHTLNGFVLTPGIIQQSDRKVMKKHTHTDTHTTQHRLPNQQEKCFLAWICFCYFFGIAFVQLKKICEQCKIPTNQAYVQNENCVRYYSAAIRIYFISFVDPWLCFACFVVVVVYIYPESCICLTGLCTIRFILHSVLVSMIIITLLRVVCTITAKKCTCISVFRCEDN